MSQFPAIPCRSPNRSHDRRYFYKYVSAKTAKIVLQTRRLRWSSPILFNDPFDVTQELRLHFNPNELNSMLNEEWALLIEQGRAGSVKHPVLAMLGKLLDAADPSQRTNFANQRRRDAPTTTPGQIAALDELREFWRQVVPTLRVLCLSELNDVTPMWLHYADAYGGVVLEFDSVDEIDSCFLVARQVKYDDTPPAIADARTWVRCLLFHTEKSFIDLLTEYQYTKTMSWAYEREWRIVSRARPGDSGLFSDHGFHPRELSRIFFGPKCTEADKTDIVALLSNELEHVCCCEAVPSREATKFTFRPTTRVDASQNR